MKKLTKLLLCLALLVSLSGCDSKKGRDEFALYTKTMPNRILATTSLSIDFIFDNPENYGIKRDSYGLDYVSLKDYKAYIEDLENIPEELDDYDYKALTKDQKITYDLLKNYTEDSDIPLEDGYYLSANYFDLTNGIQSNLPFTMWNYKFKHQTSLDTFVNILKQAPTYFKKYTDLEATRQKKGFGMSAEIMERVIQSLHIISTSDQSYILNAAYEKLDTLTFLTDQQKQEYKTTITSLFHDSFLPAFAQAEQDLSAIKILKKGEGELASYSHGKEYYEEFVCNDLGFNSIKEYSTYLDVTEDNINNRVQALLQEYPELKDLLKDKAALNNAMSSMKLTSLGDSNEVIQYLEQRINTGKDFPAIQKLEYEMLLVPASMKETSGNSAAYFVSAVDDLSGKDETMILNGTFYPADFQTYAHEGFPGHMYQNNYFKTVKHDVLRNILESYASSEGWATYIEEESCDYSDEPATCRFTSEFNQLNYLLILKLDKMIHYDGLSREETYAYLRKNINPNLTDENVQSLYEQILQQPGIYSKYYGGCYRILDLKDQAMKQWGNAYSDYRFHKMILDLGNLPLDLLEKHSNL